MVIALYKILDISQQQPSLPSKEKQALEKELLCKWVYIHILSTL